MTPEAKACQQIDEKLHQAGWAVQDTHALNLTAARGVAVREYSTDTGPADYLLFVDRQPVGVIEAKKDSAGASLILAESQTARYASATLKWRKNSAPLRFLFEATGQIIRFTDGADPAPRSREVFHFFRPETLAEWLAQPQTLRRRLTEQMPQLPTRSLRDCQISAVKGLEKSLAQNKPRALIHMATGAGKTFTAITAVYRLLKFGGAKRVLFLVDTRNLGKQAHQEFMAYTPPDDGRKFTELYNVQRLASSHIDPHAQVCISTIQRMYSVLSGQAMDESAEDLSLNEVRQTETQEKLVRYNPAVPVESFDFIVIDECHRSIYNLWKQVLDYFDASLIGLTATPDKRTYGFFNENIVAEYTYEQSVVDGVNVGYDVYEIETDITQKGSTLPAREWVDHRQRDTRKKRWAQTEEDTPYSGKDLDKSVVNLSQIRQVIQAMKTAVETQIFPARKEVPKTLIFAKTDSHADDIIRAVREVYGQGNDFCRKVTYSEKDADGILASFRNDYNPRIAVTVDMIATGTDVKPLEVLLFMRDVRSRGYYEQMKGRGVRSLDGDSLKRVTGSAPGAKDRFVLIDAVGVEKSLKTESRPLEKKPGVALKDLLQGVALGSRDDDTVQSLGNRLVRLAKQLDEKAQARIEKASGGIPVRELGKALITALDPDAIVQTALATAQTQGITRSEDTRLPEEIEAARNARVADACAPFRPTRTAQRTGKRPARQRANPRPHQPGPGHLRRLQRTGRSPCPGHHRPLYRLHPAAQRRNCSAQLFLPTALPTPRPHLRHDRRTAPAPEPAAADAHHRKTLERLRPRAKPPSQRRQRQAPAHRPDLTATLCLEAGHRAQTLCRRSGQTLPNLGVPPQRPAPHRLHPRINGLVRLMKDHIASSCSINRDDFDYAELADQGGLQKA